MPFLWAAEDYKQRGKELCLEGRYAEALKYLEKAVAQNRRSGALWYLAIARQHLYDFDGAIDAIEAYLPNLHSEEWLGRADSLLAECKIGQRAFEHTLDVVVIDSMLVPRQNFFEFYHLGEESGRILPSKDGLLFENQSGNHRIFPYEAGFGECHKFQDQWDEIRPLKGIGSSAFQVLDPFLLTDGETLFFACDSTPGMGGLDIYRTTFDAEEGKFYQPERMGMPFNSPFDDYMMAVDETHKVGWWATERNAVPDSVMIYLFLFDDEEKTLDEPTISRARIDCLSETWEDAAGYADLLEQIYHPQVSIPLEDKLHIIIAEGVIYDSVDQFRSQDAREAFVLSEKTVRQIEETTAKLNAMRLSYSKSNETQRTALASQILECEDRLLSLKQFNIQLENRYRALENVAR